MTRALAICCGVLFAFTACKKGSEPPSGGPPKPAAPVAQPAPPAPPPPAVTPALPPAPAAAVDAKLLLGTWNSKDNPGVTWKFNADGTKHTKTAYTEIPGTYKVDGANLTLKGKDVPEGQYTILELTPNKLVLRDEKHGGVRDVFTR
jgi:hypothetical protein